MADAHLATLLPAPGLRLEPDEILSRFVEYAASSGLTLYPAQEEAILELLGDKHVILKTPTGSGKSLVAVALHFKSLSEDRVSYYTSPTKALCNEKFFALCQDFGPDNVGMMTGDASINRDAPIICCTAEILSSLALRESNPIVDYAVLDEFHYYADKERGIAWQIPLLALRNTTFLLMSATLGDTRDIERSIQEFTGRAVAVVESRTRPVPLDFGYRDTPLHETISDLVEAGRAPIYLVNFTQRACAEQAQNLMSVNFASKEDKERLRQALEGVPFDTPYGKELQRFLRHGLGLHHAGLLPRYRLLVEKLAQAGLLKVVSGTDTLGVGVNIPIRTVLYTQLCKYDGERTRILSVRDFLQIGGRAGRKGFDDRGSVVAQAPEHVIENLRLGQKQAQGKKVVKKQPPTKGYVHWDKSTFERLQNGTPEPLESRFEVTHGLLLSLLQSDPDCRGGGYGRLVELIRRSHGGDRTRRTHLRTAAERFKSLREAGVIDVVRTDGGRGSTVVVSPDLQRDFSLNKTLSLYLLDVLDRIDPDAEMYALDVLSVVESIVEDPMAVLFRQLDKLKTDKLAELKGKGVEYAERIEELDKLEWPKPLGEFIYRTFNEFAERHPWVGHENIRPKSVAREIVERYCSFHDYIREYGLQRTEGVLLRYLTDVYKTLLQNVPETFWSEEIEDLIVHLRSMLRGVDSSLIDEWESMREPSAPTRAAALVAKAPERTLADDPRALSARIRGELHRVLKALADRDYELAAAFVYQVEGEWPAGRLAAEMEPFWAEHKAVDLTPHARKSHNTLLRQGGPRRWEARQKIIGVPVDATDAVPAADIEDSDAPVRSDEWMLDCVVDLDRANRPEDAPLIELRRIGT